MREPRWNHNIHYHPVLRAALPADCERVLDVGCGEGLFTVELGRVARHVTGVDRDAASIERARDKAPAANIDYVVGDFLTHPFEPASFDGVVCVAALHHMDGTRALLRMKELLRPGGTLGVIGLARSGTPLDFAVDGAAAVGHRVLVRSRRLWETSAPKLWRFPETYRQARRTAERVLPGVRYRRHLLWRYSLIWTKPRG
jgi:2-polyprenyl-3-methyl-5-hydroxy-6-metoxy-1,4-benzoquinol methylase